MLTYGAKCMNCRYSMNVNQCDVFTIQVLLWLVSYTDTYAG